MPVPPTTSRPIVRGQDVPESEHEQAAKILAEMAVSAHGFNVSLSLELHDDGLLDTPTLCLKMLERIDMPNVGVNPDLGNICRGHDGCADWQEALRVLAPHAICWHVKNYVGGRLAPLWAGGIDYALASSIMQGAHYNGPISGESYCGDVLDQQIRGLAYLKQLAQKNVATAEEARTR
jgi:sugar phosphate isomerase/epimerase